LAIAAIGTALMLIRRHRVVTLVGLCCACLGASALNADLRFAQRGPLAAIATEVPRCRIEAVVVEAVGNLGTIVDTRRIECGGAPAADVGVLAIKDEVAPAGAQIHAQGWIVPLEDDPFDAAFSRSGAQARLHPIDIEVIARPSGALGVAERVRRGLDGSVQSLDPRVGGLIKGLTIGDTSDLGEDTLQSFRNAGLSHVLAVSGSNVAIVLGAVLVGLRRAALRLRVALGFTGLALFVLIVGPDPSVLRAAAMGSIALSCLAYGRSAEPLAALGLAVIAVVTLRPGLLLSVGMQLSTAATAGIVLFTAPIERRLWWLPSAMRLLIAATLAAQVAVAPLLILVFGEISVIAPLANALALPAVAPGTVIGLAAGFLSVPLPWIGALLAKVVAPAAAWILAVADHMGRVSWALVHLSRGWGWVAFVAVVSWGCHVMRQGVQPAG
jgi:ComEC/Rec2-related protein